MLGEAGLEVDFWRIAMRPGKPLIFGRLNDTPLLGLPGNPVSSMVCAMIFLRPALHALLAADSAPDEGEPARLGADLGKNDEREDYLRASLATDEEGDSIATPFGVQDSSMFANMARADCLIVREPFAPAARKGAAVRILRLRGGTVGI